MVLLSVLAAVVPGSAQGGFTVGDGAFLLDGEPFVVKAAELHYPRIPRQYWAHRIDLCKALGMNTICLYTFWNIHEQQPGEFDFSGGNDIRHFIELCHERGMKVILRPGPYVCAEWEMGGLPWWLLTKKDVRLRENDPWFMERVDLFQQQLAAQVGDLTAADGGPIIMVQVENEYGSYGTDKAYVGAVRDMLRRNFGTDVTLFQCDWSSNFLNNGLPDLIWTLNFGTGADIDSQFAPLKAARPDAPLMCSEFWSGWFDKWGANHETRPAGDMIAGIDEMLSKGISFSLYMTHGGTNFGHWAGANSPGYAPDVTSYDYDAPISESGQVTPKYMALRSVMQRHNGGAPLPPIPASPVAAPLPEFRLDEVAPLFDNLPTPHHDNDIRTMEEYGQGFGSIMYRTYLPASDRPAVLTVRDVHDYAQVFVDGHPVGTLDRRNGARDLEIPAVRDSAVLDILVEATGRINFGRAIKDFKGITDSVTISRTVADGAPAQTVALHGWTVYNLEDSYTDYTAGVEFRPAGDFVATDGERMPRGVYRGYFDLAGTPHDTFLDFSTWGKGLVYVNGHALGRFWEIGPQQTLYMPGPWLRSGRNEVVVFDIIGPSDTRIEGLEQPVLDNLRLPRSSVAGTDRPDLEEWTSVADGTLAAGGGWKSIDFATPVTARFFALEVLGTHDSTGRTSVAELYLLGADGERLSREAWTAAYADSEDVAANHTADKTFDLQESTYWQTAEGVPVPHLIVIDLGDEYTLTGFQLLPRAESGAPGAIARYRIYTK